MRRSGKLAVGCLLVLLLWLPVALCATGTDPELMTKEQILEELTTNSKRIENLLSQQEGSLSQSSQEVEGWRQDLQDLMSRQAELLLASESHESLISKLQEDYRKQGTRLEQLEQDHSTSQKTLKDLRDQQSSLSEESKRHTQTIEKLQSSQDETESSFESYKTESEGVRMDLNKQIDQLEARMQLRSIAGTGAIVAIVLILIVK